MTPISEREIGSIEEKVKSLEHRAKSDRTSINALIDEIDSVRLELHQFKNKVYGVGSALIFFLSILTWMLDYFVRS